jgi:hypothetical protein
MERGRSGTRGGKSSGQGNVGPGTNTTTVQVQAAGDQWLRRPAPSDLKVIVVDIDRASIDALGLLAEAAGDDGAAGRGGATGRHPDATSGMAIAPL